MGKATEATKDFAVGDDLGGDNPFLEVELPVLGKWVRVRPLETPEIARLQYLPDVMRLSTLIAEVVENADAVSDPEWAAANVEYQVRVAHIATIADPEDLTPLRCPECEFNHARSLWSLTAARRLRNADLEAISAIALSPAGVATEEVEAIRSFLADPTP